MFEQITRDADPAREAKRTGYVLCAICWAVGAVCGMIGRSAALHACAAFAFALGGLLLSINIRRAEAKEREAGDETLDGFAGRPGPCLQISCIRKPLKMLSRSRLSVLRIPFRVVSSFCDTCMDEGTTGGANTCLKLP
jgi:hypothetical protein